MTAAEVTVTLCTSCPLGREGFADTLRATLAAKEPRAHVATVECMSGCTRPSTIAIRAPGKTAYLFGEICAADLPLIENFLHHYCESGDGNFDDARVLGDLRLKAIARIPGEPKTR
ncbi:DUF1636 family protein [Sediminimonas qiaohouensis]|uniref:DUF1636 family protein n=1 Tax=Sediminimonas qiaohouensis TaxID=552061 RepID=UPI0003F72D43|nr:DUF1636 family protein [Sediminimonas qiaohouensis]